MDAVRISDIAGKPGTVSVSGDATPVAFPLGGVGTGNVSVGARGQLRDWEIFNRPGKGDKLPYSFFALRAAGPSLTPTTRILESKLTPPYEASHGYYPGDMAGLPRMSRSELHGSYPFVVVDLEDDDLPLSVRMEAFTPLVPLDAAASGIPGAVLRYHVINTSEEPMEVTVAGSIANGVGLSGYELFFFPSYEGRPANRYRDDDTCRGIEFFSDLPPDHLRHGTMALMTTAANVTYKTQWLDGYWWDGIHDFWDEFSSTGRLTPESAPGGLAGPLSEPSKLRVGSVAVTETIPAGTTHTFEFALSWHFPNRPRGWLGHIAPANDTCATEVVENFYTTQFEDAWDAGSRLLTDIDLERRTRAFHAELFASTLPDAVLGAVSTGMVVMRSTTCFRLADGTFLGWEGCFDHQGSCEGNCTHVWNYAQTVAFLFPELERSMRRTEFLLETDEAGAMAFRSYRVFGGERWDMLPAVDGQLGCVVRLFRDWTFSADDEFLRSLWPAAQRALDYALVAWDSDGDGVLDSEQHNTYDIEFHGPNSLTNSVYLAALLAGSELAAHLGDQESSARYTAAAAQGAKTMDALLWGGDYYVQVIDDVDTYRYQYGRGCLSDQVFGQFLAHVAGLGYVLPEDHVKQAIASVHRHNFLAVNRHQNVQRTYALNDESGLVLCSWPEGGRPRLPFVYSDEVWAGIEYQVASHLVYEGLVSEGVAIVEALRRRHDGWRRNPWNEIECGNHYVRSMASWALLLAMSGYSYRGDRQAIGFDPRNTPEDFRCLVTTGSGWGSYRQTARDLTWTAEIALTEGHLPLQIVSLRPSTSADMNTVRLTIDGEEVAGTAVRRPDGVAVVTWDGSRDVQSSVEVVFRGPGALGD